MIDLEQEHLTHWKISFSIRVDNKYLDELPPEEKELLVADEDNSVWMDDTVVIRGPLDGLGAVDKLRTYVLDPQSEYEIPCVEFHLKGVKLLSQALF